MLLNKKKVRKIPLDVYTSYLYFFKQNYIHSKKKKIDFLQKKNICNRLKLQIVIEEKNDINFLSYNYIVMQQHRKG